MFVKFLPNKLQFACFHYFSMKCRESTERMPYGQPGKYPTPESADKPTTEGLSLPHLPPHTSAIPMLIGPTGLPAHPLPLSHLPPNHPSLVSSPQTATVPPNTSSSIQGTHSQRFLCCGFHLRAKQTKTHYSKLFILSLIHSTTAKLAGLNS